MVNRIGPAMKGILLTATLSVLAALPAYACPNILGYVDANCDGKLQVLAVGDSITFGRGDKPGNEGGYPKRLAEYFAALSVQVEIQTFAKPGKDCLQLLELLKPRITKNKDNLQQADVAILLCGTNSYWRFLGLPLEDMAAETKQDLQKVRKLLKKYMYVEVASLPPTKRSWQQPFIEAVNDELGGLVKVHFADMPKSGISKDKLHPNPEGHDFLFERALLSLSDVYNVKAQSALKLKDDDGDGVYDKFESALGCSNKLADSDGDGLNDRDEVFTHHTLCKKGDTDGDGVSDYLEVLAGTNPLL